MVAGYLLSAPNSPEFPEEICRRILVGHPLESNGA